MTFDILKGGAQRRLQVAKVKAARLRAVNPGLAYQLTWLDARTKLNVGSDAGRGYNEDCGRKVPVFYAFREDALPVRTVRTAAEILGHRYGGYYTDGDCGETAHGIVAYIGRGRWLAGYHWSSNDERVLFLDQTHDTEDDAARMADEHARIFAERRQEDCERFDAMQDAETRCDDLCTELRGMLPGRNASTYIREQVRDIIEQLREARYALAEATKAYERA